MQEISSTQTFHLMKRFPKIELSYETIPHKKVSPEYNVCLTIPVGKKIYLWFSFDVNKNVCYFLDTNREKKITKTFILKNMHFDHSLSLGTILYGTFIESTDSCNMDIDSCFVIEDILFYKGVSMKNLFYGEKLGFIESLLKKDIDPTNAFAMKLPILWGISKKEEYNCEYFIPDQWINRAKYGIHHLQYRCLNEIAPYMNIFSVRKTGESTTKIINESAYRLNTDFRCDYNRPQYKMKTVFLVSADLQFDIYNLFAYGHNKESIYYNIAYIPNYKTSIFMNRLFRKIKENENLDAIEESDDEDDFENTAQDKYVDLQKTMLIECSFHFKFRKWVPLRVVNDSYKVVHISQLVLNWKR